MGVTLDAAKFHKRAKYLLDLWKVRTGIMPLPYLIICWLVNNEQIQDSKDDFGNANVLLVPVGQSQDDVLYQKSIALQVIFLEH